MEHAPQLGEYGALHVEEIASFVARPRHEVARMAVGQPFHEGRRVVAHPIAELGAPVVAIAAQSLLLDALRYEVPFLKLAEIALERSGRKRLRVFAAHLPLHVLVKRLRLVFGAELRKCPQDRDVLYCTLARKHVAERRGASGEHLAGRVDERRGDRQLRRFTSAGIRKQIRLRALNPPLHRTASFLALRKIAPNDSCSIQRPRDTIRLTSSENRKSFHCGLERNDQARLV